MQRGTDRDIAGDTKGGSEDGDRGWLCLCRRKQKIGPGQGETERKNFPSSSGLLVLVPVGELALEEGPAVSMQLVWGLHSQNVHQPPGKEK